MAIGVVACLPPALWAGPGGGPDGPFLVGASVLSVAGLVAQAMRDRLGRRARELAVLAVLVGAGTLLIGLAARSTLPVHDLLGHIAALQVTTSAIRRPAVRLTVQAMIIVGTTVLLVRDVSLLGGTSPIAGVVGPVLLLAAVTALASALASDLERARRTAAAAAHRSAVRADLLDAVRDVAHAGQQQVFAGAVEGLLALGFDVAAVALLRGDALVPEHVAGLRWEQPLPVVHPQAQRVLASHRPVVLDDYTAAPDAVAGVRLGTVLVVPVRAEGRPLGVLMAAHRRPGAPVDADVEVVDVLAAHLAAVLVTERTERRQRELLTRLRELEELRAGFITRVTDDLRDPLTVVRLASQGLATRAADLQPDRRGRLASALAEQAGQLERTIEALLDFSRGTPDRDGTPEIVDVRDVLVPARRSGMAITGTARGAVLVDLPLLRRAIEVLWRADPDREHPVDVRATEEDITLAFRLTGLTTLEGDVAWSVGEQLAVAAGIHITREGDVVCLRLPRADVRGGGAR